MRKKPDLTTKIREKVAQGKTSAVGEPLHPGTSGRLAPSRRGDSRATGPGRLLVLIYAVFALSASARAGYQIATKFDEAPVAYLLSAFAAAVYLVATVSLSLSGRKWYRISLIAVLVELFGVLVIGVASVLDLAAFPHDTVWSGFGRGYGFVPVLLPLLGLIWLYRMRPSRSGKP